MKAMRGDARVRLAEPGVYDAAAQHRERGRARPGRVHGQQRAALEDPVDAHRGPVR